MVIYEVNLTINTEIYPQFQLWLKKHAAEIIQFPGFIQAYILRQDKEEISNQKKLTVQYLLDNRDVLDKYFVELAPMMREEGLNLFQNQFSAERRVLEVDEVIFK